MLLLAPTQGAASKSLYENDLQFLPKTSLNSTLAQHQQYKQLLSLMLPLRLKTLQSAMTFGPHSKFFWNPGPLPSEETVAGPGPVARPDRAAGAAARSRSQEWPPGPQKSIVYFQSCGQRCKDMPQPLWVSSISTKPGPPP